MPVTDKAPVSAEELDRRTAILRRFRELLIQQRERFCSYLTLLEKQQTVITSGNAEELVAHVDLEEQIVADIFSIQKVIEPLETLYHSAVPPSSASDVPALKTSLENLRSQAAARSARNRSLLSARMGNTRAEITRLRNNPFASRSRSAYQNSVTASFIDIKG